jgi:hypothetical protein
MRPDLLIGVDCSGAKDAVAKLSDFFFRCARASLCRAMPPGGMGGMDY